MSDTIGSGHPHHVEAGPSGPPSRAAAQKAGQNVAEAYAFACLNCGHGWEQAYEIEHHVDASGHPFVTYLADGAKVPSPLTRPACLNCGGQHVRIMRSGQVSDLASTWAAPHGEQEGHGEQDGRGERGERRARHWSVLHLLRLRRRGETDTA